MLRRGDLFRNLVMRDLKQRYKGSVLGFLWSLLTPLIMALIYVVFLRVLASRTVSIAEIIIGVFAWQFTVQSVQGGMMCITGNGNLVRKVAFPRIALPLSSVVANLVNYLLTVVAQFVLVALLLASQGQCIKASACLVPLLILYQTLFHLGLALLVAAANVYFRDTQHLVGLWLTGWFFLSPAMYNLQFVDAQAAQYPFLSRLYLLNPMAPIITGYRALILPGTSFPWNVYSMGGILIPVLVLVLGFVVFESVQRYFADYL